MIKNNIAAVYVVSTVRVLTDSTSGRQTWLTRERSVRTRTTGSAQTVET